MRHADQGERERRAAVGNRFWTRHSARHPDEVRPAPLQFGHTAGKMLGKIDIVMVEKRDVLAPCQAETVVVGA